jgi:hypothetical protein
MLASEDLPSVSISVGPVNHSFSKGSSFAKIFTPSMAAKGKNVVLDEANPAEAKKGLRASTMSSYRS